MTNQQTIDQARSEVFAQHMLEMLNGAGLSLMISIGHKTRLFDLLAQLPPSTSEQIAQAAGLQERYVREWLAAMVTGRVMEYDAASRTYRLPAEHAVWLTRAAGPNNLAFQTQYIALLASVQDGVVACFSQGGGVPYSSFPQFQRLIAEDSAQVVDASLLQVTLPAIPGLVERLQAGIEVADIGCGSGHAINVREGTRAGTCPLWTNESPTTLRACSFARGPGLLPRGVPPQAFPIQDVPGQGVSHSRYARPRSGMDRRENLSFPVHVFYFIPTWAGCQVFWIVGILLDEQFFDEVRPVTLGATAVTLR